MTHSCASQVLLDQSEIQPSSQKNNGHMNDHLSSCHCARFT